MTLLAEDLTAASCDVDLRPAQCVRDVLHEGLGTVCTIKATRFWIRYLAVHRVRSNTCPVFARIATWFWPCVNYKYD